MIYLDDFLPIVDGICSDDNTYGSYKSLSKAEIACSLNEMCIGIVDEGCDNNGTYRLCTSGFISPIYTQNPSCIHKKNEHPRKYLYRVLI